MRRTTFSFSQMSRASLPALPWRENEESNFNVFIQPDEQGEVACPAMAGRRKNKPKEKMPREKKKRWAEKEEEKNKT